MGKCTTANCSCKSGDNCVDVTVNSKSCGGTTPVIRCKSGAQGPPGMRGSRGFMGPPGAKGVRGVQGPQGTKGVPGPPGPKGSKGSMGLMGEPGPTGPMGVQGPTGVANTWFVGSICDTFTDPRPPIFGDFLLNIEDCVIYQYDEGWQSTGKTLECTDPEGVIQAIREVPKPTQGSVGDCTISLTLPDCASIFVSGTLSITQVVIFNEVEATPVGTFSTPQELAELLAPFGWIYSHVFETNIYVLSVNIEDKDPTGTLSYMTFSNMDSFNLDTQCKTEACFECEDFQSGSFILVNKNDGIYWVEPECFITNPTGLGGNSGTGPRGPTGATGLRGATGVTGPVSCDIVLDCIRTIDLPEPDCMYVGVQDTNCFTFLQNINQSLSIATALDNPSNIVSGPISFNNNTSYRVALESLDTIIVENFVKVSSSTLPINRIYYFNSNGQVIASVTLNILKCCPTGIEASETRIMTRLSGERLGWVDPDCIFENSISIQEELAKLPECKPFKYNLQLDASEPFMNNNENVFPFPWQFSLVSIIGEDVTNEYEGNINSIIDFINLLKDNNWSSLIEDGSTFFRTDFRDNMASEPFSEYKLMDANGSVFFCSEIATTESETVDENLQVLYRLGSGTTVSGSPTKIFDSVSNCDGLEFTCTTTMLTECIFNDLTGIGPYNLSELVTAGVKQNVLTTQFNTIHQLNSLLVNLGWSLQATNVYTLSQVLENPSNESYVKIRNGNGSIQTLNLPISCKAECPPGSTAMARLVMTKQPDGTYCWSDPACFSGGDTIINCEVQGATSLNNPLNDIPSCDLTPRFDLQLVIHSDLINIICDHFSNNGPYWIYSYKTGDNDEIVQEKIIQQPFNLTNLVQALVDLGWTSNPAVSDILLTTDEVELNLNNSENFVVGICVNLVGNDGDDLPFNYTIPITNIVGQSCPGLSSDTKMLLKTETGFCYVDIDCIMPQIPEPVNVPQEILDIPECEDESTYLVCVRLDNCDVEKILDTFGVADQIVLTEYRLINNERVSVNFNLGASFVLEQLISALLSLGWSSENSAARPVELLLETSNNIQYLTFNRLGADPNKPPYPFLIGTSCTEIASCPSTDPRNFVLIRKPPPTTVTTTVSTTNPNGSTNSATDVETEGKSELCWTPICPIKGPKGDTGARGPQGAMGAIGLQGTQGPTGNVGPTGAQGNVGATGLQGSVGATGVANVDCDEFDIIFNITEEDMNNVEDPIGATGITIGTYNRIEDKVNVCMRIPYNINLESDMTRIKVRLTFNTSLPGIDYSIPINFQFTTIEAVNDDDELSNPNGFLDLDGLSTKNATFSPLSIPSTNPIRQTFLMTTSSLDFKVSCLDTRMNTTNTDIIDIHSTICYKLGDLDEPIAIV